MPVTPSSVCPLCASPKSTFLCRPDNRDYYLCPECRLVFLNPELLPLPREELARYREHQNTPDNPGYKEFLGKLFNPLIKLLPEGARGLEFGCGPGPVLAQMLRDSGFIMDTYDPYFSPDPEVFTRKYDFITATEVFEHLFSPGMEIGRLFSLLKPNGTLGVMTRLYDDDTDFSTWYYRRDPTHVCFYSRETFYWIADTYQRDISVIGDDVIIIKKR